MGFFNFERDTSKNRIKRNKSRGAAAERDVVDTDSILEGWNSKKTGRGHDFKQTRTNILTGRREERYVEVKSGNAKLSKLQKREKRRLEKQGKKYVVRRQDPWVY